MKKERLPKDDGRYIIFYSFEEGDEEEEPLDAPNDEDEGS